MINDNSLTVILLCSHVLPQNPNYKPLSLGEWNTIVRQLIDCDLKNPESLLNMTDVDIQMTLQVSKEMSERIHWLLSRGAAMSVALENLDRKGISVVTRADSFYPKRLKQNLKHLAPSLLFYSGDISLCNYEGIGIVGSRNIKDNAIEFTKKIVTEAVSERLAIYSGGAKGVDSISEQICLNENGKVIAYIADSLESKIKKVHIREQIEKKNLLLLTSVNPNLGFSAPIAMNRNKYIYASSEATFVISSDFNKGGTWAGAVDCIKKKWTTTFVVIDSSSKGNEELIKKGAIAVNLNEQLRIKSMIEENKSLLIPETNPQLDLFSLPTRKELKCSIFPDKDNQISESTFEKNILEVSLDETSVSVLDAYKYVLPLLLLVLENENTIEEISQKLNVNKNQISKWINRAVKDGLVKKLKNPVRYIVS